MQQDLDDKREEEEEDDEEVLEMFDELSKGKDYITEKALRYVSETEPCLASALLQHSYPIPRDPYPSHTLNPIIPLPQSYPDFTPILPLH